MKTMSRILAIILAVMLVAGLAVTAAAAPVEDTLVDTWFIHNGTRNNFHSFIGVVIKVGGTDITVTHIGRFAHAGNSQEHVLKLADAETNQDVEGATVTVNMAGATENTFVYGQLAAPVTLKAGKTYYLVSQENFEGDAFAEHGFRTDINGAVEVTGGVYFLPEEGANYGYHPDNAGHYGFVGLDIKYTVDAAVAGTPNELISGIMYADNYMNSLRDHGMKIGTMFTVGDKDIWVSELGRKFFTGGTNAHTMWLVDAATGARIVGSTAVVPAGGTAGEYTYGKLTAPVKLEAGKKYYVICEEIGDDGDKWLEGGSLAAGNDGIELNGSAYWDAGMNNNAGGWAEANGTFFAATSLKYGFSLATAGDNTGSGSGSGNDNGGVTPPPTGDIFGVVVALMAVSGTALVVLKKKF